MSAYFHPKADSVVKKNVEEESAAEEGCVEGAQSVPNHEEDVDSESDKGSDAYIPYTQDIPFYDSDDDVPVASSDSMSGVESDGVLHHVKAESTSYDMEAVDSEDDNESSAYIPYTQEIPFYDSDDRD